MNEISANIRVKTENFRAINEADIIINGITVVAGENGCGKSSISKLLYFLYKTVSNYDLLVKNKLLLNLSDVITFLEILIQEITRQELSNERALRNDFRREITELRKNLLNSEYLEDELGNWLKMVEKLELAYNYSAVLSYDIFKPNTIRLEYIIKDIFKNENINQEGLSLFSQVKAYFEAKFKEAIGKIKSRPTSLFTEELKAVFSDGILPKTFEVLEFDDLIVSLDIHHLSIPYSIQNAIYIDTPMMISVNDSHNIYWDDLNELLVKKSKGNSKYTQLISKEIIQGDIFQEEEGFPLDNLKFRRNDGAVFNLLDVATGIKAFSILQMLLKNGSLTDKTLLIIDEPESHLHPQWIIEYARIVVLLNKELGVKFFIATHNPDMVSAIRYISEKEGTLKDVNFYLANKSSENFNYNFTFLGKEIDPIFESFNIAIERINKYGL